MEFDPVSFQPKRRPALRRTPALPYIAVTFASIFPTLSRIGGHLLERLERRRIHSERDGVHRERAHARDRQPAPEDAPAARPVTLHDAVPRARILRAREIVDLQTTLDNVDWNVHDPRQHPGKSAGEEHRPHAGAIWRHVVAHQLVARDVDGESDDLARHRRIQAGEAASKAVRVVDVAQAVDRAGVARRDAGDGRQHACNE